MESIQEIIDKARREMDDRDREKLIFGFIEYLNKMETDMGCKKKPKKKGGKK